MGLVDIFPPYWPPYCIYANEARSYLIKKNGYVYWICRYSTLGEITFIFCV